MHEVYCGENTLLEVLLVCVLSSCIKLIICYCCFSCHQSEVWICMELMSTCLDKLLKKTGMPIPEKILGKMAVAVSTVDHRLDINAETLLFRLV